MKNIGTDLYKAIYFSNSKVECNKYIPNDKAFIADTDGCVIFLLSPKAFHEYKETIRQIEIDFPLLAELK